MNNLTPHMPPSGDIDPGNWFILIHIIPLLIEHHEFDIGVNVNHLWENARKHCHQPTFNFAIAWMQNVGLITRFQDHTTWVEPTDQTSVAYRIVQQIRTIMKDHPNG